jgi:hypothetical protein
VQAEVAEHLVAAALIVKAEVANVYHFLFH